MSLEIPPRENLLSIRVSQFQSIDEAVESIKDAIYEGRCVISTFVNPYSYYVAERDDAYRRALESFDFVFCDGIGLVLAARLMAVAEIPRVSFDSTSLAPIFFDWCEREGLGVYLIGGRPGVAEKAFETLKQEYPALKVSGAESGYFESIETPIRRIIGSGARFVVCGMGIPNQEEFILALRESGWIGAGFTCGGYLDQLGNSVKYYPDWVDRLNIRFAYRLLDEPGRLWRRYLIQYFPFIRRFLAAILLGSR